MNLSIRIEIFKEGEVYVALSPELNVSSFGDTIDDARDSIKEAIEAFLEECHEMGTLTYLHEYDHRRHDQRTILRTLRTN